MTVWIYLPLLLALPLTFATRWIAARGAPGTAAHGLTAVAVVATLCSTWSLALLSLTLFDDLPSMSALHDDPSLNLPEPVKDPVAVAATVMLLWCGVRLARDLHRRLSTVRRLRAAGSPDGGLVVADLTTPMAVAVPGDPGHLLVTTAMLRLLDADERRVVFAHEQAHLTHHHHRLVTAAAAAAALNPLLIPVRDAVGYLVERWADEDAAAVVGDRDLTAQAIARAALATGSNPAAAALGMHGGAAVNRVLALGEPVPPSHHRRLLGPAALGAAGLTAVAVATYQFVELVRAWR
jgi:hypothetical protein